MSKTATEFTFSVYNAALATAGNLDVLVRVPVGTYITLEHGGSLGGDAVSAFYQGVTVSATGTAVPVYDRNRVRPATPTTQVFSGPTVTNTGTLLHQDYFPGGAGGVGNTLGSSLPLDHRYILPPGDHLLRLTNISGSTQGADVMANFIENPAD